MIFPRWLYWNLLYVYLTIGCSYPAFRNISTKFFVPYLFYCFSLVLCQDLVQVKMSFSHSNLPAIPKLPVDTAFQNHRVTCNRNDYEFVWYYKTFPSIQIPGGMHVCNC